MPKKKKKESLFGMLRQGDKYETEQAKRTKAHPIRKRAKALDAIDEMKKDLMTPVETEAQRKKRLQREKEARRRAKDNAATRSVKNKIGTGLTEKEKMSYQK